MEFNHLETSAKALATSIDVKDINELYVNPLEVIAKTTKHTLETLQDLDALLTGLVLQAPVINFLTPDLDLSRQQRTLIMDKAQYALWREDFSEAAYQYKRELLFSELARDLDSSVDDAMARAALNAIKRDATAQEIYSEMLDTQLRVQNENSRRAKTPNGLMEFW